MVLELFLTTSAVTKALGKLPSPPAPLTLSSQLSSQLQRKLGNLGAKSYKAWGRLLGCQHRQREAEADRQMDIKTLGQGPQGART